MSRKTKKVGITGKYGPRYGSSLKHRARLCMEAQCKKYECTFCGKIALKRVAVGIWECRRCQKRVTGGAYAPVTALQSTVKLNVSRVSKEISK